MNTHSLAPFLLGGGLLLVLLSLTAPHMIGGRFEWSQDDAARFQQASQNYHAALHARSHASRGDGDGEAPLALARDDYLRQQASLEAARTRGVSVGWLLRWMGIVSSVFGMALYLIPIVLGEAKPSP